MSCHSDNILIPCQRIFVLVPLFTTSYKELSALPRTPLLTSVNVWNSFFLNITINEINRNGYEFNIVQVILFFVQIMEGLRIQHIFVGMYETVREIKISTICKRCPLWNMTLGVKTKVYCDFLFEHSWRQDIQCRKNNALFFK